MSNTPSLGLVHAMEKHDPDPALNRTSSLDDALRAINRQTTRRVLEKAADLEQAAKIVSPDQAPEKSQLLVRPIRNVKEMAEVYRLVHDAYVERGYIEPRKDGQLVHYPHLDNIRETTVLVAVDKGHIVGTNSLTLDGPKGLPADEDFKKECRRIRAEGRILAGSWRLCTRAGFRDERRIVLDLIAQTVRLTVRKGVKTCVFTIHPRHARVYEKLLNMKIVERKETTVHGLQNAPAIFMRCDYESLPSWCLP